MVLQYYNLREQPFGVTPDPRFLFQSPTHREALASLLYGVATGRGFTALIAKPGMGKTTLLFEFLNKVAANSETAFLFQPQRTPTDFLRDVLEDLGVEEDGRDFFRMQRKLTDVLLAQAARRRQLIVVVDEAHSLDDSLLEFLRTLSNFETPYEKLMHIVLVGQPQLAGKLSSAALTQLRQRVSIIARLEPFSIEESRQYVNYRLRVAGYDFSRPLFTKEAETAIAESSEGIPRNINNLCFNAMSLGCALKQRIISTKIIDEVISDLDLHRFRAETGERTENPVVLINGLSSSNQRQQHSRAWAFRFVLIVALVIFLGFTIMRSAHPAVGTAASVAPANAVSPEPERTTPMAQPELPRLPNTVAAGVERVPETKTIEVLPQETLYGIVARTFGRYDEHTLAVVRDLNPWLTDPSRIKAGQKIRIPNLNDKSSSVGGVFVRSMSAKQQAAVAGRFAQ